MNSILSNIKFQTKLVISFSLIILLIIVSFVFYLHNNIFIKIKDNITNSDMQLCVKVSENIDTYIEKMDDITKKLISNTELQKMLDEANSALVTPGSYKYLIYERKFADIVSDAITLTSFPLLNVYIYNENRDYVFVYNENTSNLSRIIIDKESAKFLNDKHMVIFPGKSYISFFRAVFDINAKKYGYVEVQDSYDYISKICNIGSTGEVIIIDNRSQIIYCTNKESSGIGNLLAENSREQPKGVFEDNSGNIYFYSSSEYSGLTVFIKHNAEILYQPLSLLVRATYIVMLIVMFASIILIFVFSRLLVKPLRNLRDSVLQVSYKNMGLEIDSTGNNEIIMLRDAFQHILDELKDAVEKEIISSKAEAKARFAALQAQIAPHFIYNVLYTISISAQEHRIDDVVSMCKQLSDMLRYTVNSGPQIARLEDELNCAYNYLSLQSKNYEDFLFYEINIQDGTRDIALPKLSVQPFVENAIKHGFRNCKPPYKIRIVTEVKDGRWSISVIDNGNGIMESEIDKINKRIEEIISSNSFASNEITANSNGMGIINSVLRLKMMYGESFIFSISNSSDGGTRIYLEGDYNERLLTGNYGGEKNI